MLERVSISKTQDICSDNPGYSFTSCVFTFIARTVGCQIPWIYSSLDQGETQPVCTNKKQIIEYDDLLASLEPLSGFAITNITKCPPRCTVRQYSFHKCKSEQVSWKREWSSALYLGAERTEIRREEEYWIFDSADTLNGIGGALGLFLGWSVLYLVNQVVTAVMMAYTHILSVKKI